MKLSKIRLPLAVAFLGAAACILRFCLYLLGTDEKGLLISGHPLEICLCVVTAAAAALIILRTRKQTGSCSYADNFPASVLSAAGCLLLAAGICLSVMANRIVFLPLERIRNLIGLLCLPALVFVAVCRRKGRRPGFAAHAVVCLYLALYTTSFYSQWSRHPQLQDSFFPMMGCIFLALFAYYQTAFDADMGSRRMQLATGLSAVFCCIAATVRSGAAIPLYLTGALWALTNLCTLTPPNPEISETEKEELQ